MNQIPEPVLLDPISGVPLDSSYPTTARMDGYWSDKHGPGPKVMAADTLQGDEVCNAAGEKLGELSHIMIDVPSGRVAYAVLSVGGFLGLGEKLLATPALSGNQIFLRGDKHLFAIGGAVKTASN